MKGNARKPNAALVYLSGKKRTRLLMFRFTMTVLSRRVVEAEQAVKRLTPPMADDIPTAGEEKWYQHSMWPMPNEAKRHDVLLLGGPRQLRLLSLRS